MHVLPALGSPPSPTAHNRKAPWSPTVPKTRDGASLAARLCRAPGGSYAECSLSVYPVPAARPSCAPCSRAALAARRRGPMSRATLAMHLQEAGHLLVEVGRHVDAARVHL